MVCTDNFPVVLNLPLSHRKIWFILFFVFFVYSSCLFITDRNHPLPFFKARKRRQGWWERYELHDRFFTHMGLFHFCFPSSFIQCTACITYYQILLNIHTHTVHRLTHDLYTITFSVLIKQIHNQWITWLSTHNILLLFIFQGTLILKCLSSFLYTNPSHEIFSSIPFQLSAGQPPSIVFNRKH